MKDVKIKDVLKWLFQRREDYLLEFFEEKDKLERLDLSSKCEELEDIIKYFKDLQEKEGLDE